MAVGFGMLGAVEAYVDGRLVDLGHARQQCVLMALLVDANKPVPVERLADRVWGEYPPQRAHNALYSYLSRLRRILGDGDGVGIRRERGGYLLAVDRESVDLHRFGELLAQARADRQDERAYTLFERALGLWRGDAFAGLDSVWLDAVRESLHQQRFAAELEYTEVRLRLGRHAQMLVELAERARAHPLDERACGQLMLALHRCGRTGDALAQYQVGRHQLAEELGIDPGPELQRLHLEILSAGSALLQPAPAVSLVSTLDAGPASAVVPRQLPARPAQFTGRAGELSRLTSALPTPDEPGAAMVLWAIDGTGGVGKTWLALRWAHEHAPSFPDGQLYVNLRGFGPSGSALDPAAAVRGFLEAFGVQALSIPADLDAMTGLYRSTLAGKRVLVVLDNARDVVQVRPLLPGSAGCLVLVTSRNRLTGLVATDGARPLSLDLLTAGEARELLAGRLGAERVAAEPDAVDEIITRCARLPLALSIAAARAATHPGFSLAALSGELDRTTGGLSAFEDDDAAADVRTVFSWSYRALSAGAATLFRLLGLHPGPDITLPAAASLTGLAPPRVRGLLAELTGAHLLVETVPGRYACHDLLRAYAAELATAHDSDEDRHAATHRMLDHYLHTAYAADSLLTHRRDPITLPHAVQGAAPEKPTDSRQALAWFTAEHPVLLAAVDQAPAAGFDTYTWQLASTLTTFLDRRGQWQVLAGAHAAALDTALRRRDKTGQANAHRGLGLAEDRLNHPDDAHSHYVRALDLFNELGNHAGQARSHQNLGRLSSAQGHYPEALAHARQTLVHYQAADDPGGQAIALNHIGWYHTKLGDHRQALPHCRQALALVQELGDLNGQAHTWDSLGYIHRHLGQYRQAIDCYRQALDLFRTTGDRLSEAIGLAYLGDTHHDAADPDAARKAWEQALDILDRLEHPDAQQVRTKLHDLRTAETASPCPR